PSFIFITGFLISNVYLSKYRPGDLQLSKRLAQRGLKVFGLFIALNLTISVLFADSYRGKILFDPLSMEKLIATYVTGNVAVAGGKLAAFYILLPISYVLMLSAGLLMACRFYKHVFHVVSLACLLGIFVLNRNGLESANLDLLTIGLLGFLSGY